MKNHFAPLLGIVLVLAGCSTGGEEETAPIDRVSEGAGSSLDSVPTLAASPIATSITQSPTPQPNPTPSPTATQASQPLPAPPGSPQTSVRGNLIKQVGELAGIRDANGEYLVSFVVNDIVVDIPCTDEFSEPSENGHFVALDVSVETSPNMLDSDLIQQFSMSSYTFQAIGPDGVTSNAGTDSVATLFCLEDSLLLPTDIGPGEKANGLVLLDVASPSGILIYEDFWTDSAWEYAY